MDPQQPSYTQPASSHEVAPLPSPQLTPPSKVQSATSIRLITVGVLLASGPATSLGGIILWVSLMKQYKLSTLQKVGIVILSGIIGPIALMLGLLAGLDAGNFFYPAIIAGAIIAFAPYVYSIAWPYGRSASQPR